MLHGHVHATELHPLIMKSTLLPHQITTKLDLTCAFIFAPSKYTWPPLWWIKSQMSLKENKS